jgi:L-aminopeptidase/D-esterase-like protein
VIDGFAIGHATADRPGWLTGTTVVLAGQGAVGGVDVRGGAPGTRETDLLDPGATVQRVHAVVLTGGSAYGLAAADGVMTLLESRGIGFAVGAGVVVPIVPAAVLFDLGRGGDLRARPDAELGRAAAEAARPDDPATGCVGAGTGAVCGGLKGGFGYAERKLSSGAAVAVAVAVNAAGSVVDPLTGRLHADPDRRLRAPSETERAALAEALGSASRPLNTTIGVVLTDATLTKAQGRRLASVAHDGLARAIRPAHLMVDGDTIFALSSGRRPGMAAEEGPRAFNELLAVAADVFTDACRVALLSAETRGPWRSYLDLAPSTRT